MTPTEALRILVAASELAALPKRDHRAIEQAAEILANAITPKDKADAPVSE
jgi:hypothetical protein